MFKQDYVMRIVEDMARGLMKLLFGTETSSSLNELPPEIEAGGMLLSVYDMVDLGKINEAEDLLFERAETGDRENLRTALHFYSYLNKKPDVFLEENGFSREEILQGLRDITVKYGVDGLEGIILK